MHFRHFKSDPNTDLPYSIIYLKYFDFFNIADVMQMLIALFTWYDWLISICRLKLHNGIIELVHIIIYIGCLGVSTKLLIQAVVSK